MSAVRMVSSKPHDKPQREVLLSLFADKKTEAQRGGKALLKFAVQHFLCYSAIKMTITANSERVSGRVGLQI